MNIVDAVTKACEKKMSIRRKSWPQCICAVPTNSHDGVILYSGIVYCGTPYRRVAPRWEPKAEDLIAQDWELMKRIDVQEAVELLGKKIDEFLADDLPKPQAE